MPSSDNLNINTGLENKIILNYIIIVNLKKKIDSLSAFFSCQL